MFTEITRWMDEVNLVNFGITEGRVGDMRVLENMTIEEYYAQVNAYRTYKERQVEAMKEASQKK